MDMYATPSRLAPGTRLNGVFEVDQRIASGGMGEIYRGHVIETGDPVAIKMMRLDLADNAMALALFRKEASALHFIHHEAIVRYYLFGHDPDTRRHYLAMEFVDGMPLPDLLRQGPLSLNAIRQLQERLALGLSAVHQHGIIHRDLSPDNVLIPGNDLAKAKIIDFGIARSTRSGDGTIIGSAFAGKYNYVSPEQLGLFGGDVTAKSDIYSLGLVLAACLLGRPLDMNGNQFEVLEKRRTVPDLTAIDRRYRPLLEKMLQPNPKDRPESMAAVAAWQPEPAAARGPGRTAGRGTAPPGGRRLAKAAAVALPLVLGIGGAGWYFAGDLVSLISALITPRTADPDKPPVIPLPPADPVKRITSFIDAYDSGEDCFFITPESVEKDEATINGLGRPGGEESLAPFNLLSSEFERYNGFPATIKVQQVTTRQCPAVSFLFQTRHRRDAAPRLDVAPAGLKDGVVNGSISGIGDRYVELLMVGDNGLARNMGALTSGGATKTFSMTLQRPDSGPPPRRPQLLIVVASSKPLAALRLPPDGAPAEQVFPQVLDEAAKAGQTLGVRAKYFTTER